MTRELFTDSRVAHHLVRGQTIHNEIRAQRDYLLKALELLLEVMPKPFTSKPVGAPGSQMRIEQDAYIDAHTAAKHAVALVRAKIDIDKPPKE